MDNEIRESFMTKGTLKTIRFNYLRFSHKLFWPVYLDKGFVVISAGKYMVEIGNKGLFMEINLLPPGNDVYSMHFSFRSLFLNCEVRK